MERLCFAEHNRSTAPQTPLRQRAGSVINAPPVAVQRNFRLRENVRSIKSWQHKITQSARRRGHHQAKVSVSPPRNKTEMNCCSDNVVPSGKWLVCRCGRLVGQSRSNQAIARSGMGIPDFSHGEKCPEVAVPTVALQNCIMLRNS